MTTNYDDAAPRLFMDEWDKAKPRVTKAMSRLIHDSAIGFGPDSGKSRLLKKLLRKLNKRRPKGTKKIKFRKLRMAAFKVPDAWQGFVVPRTLAEVTRASNPPPWMQPPMTPDEDGDDHSPTWHIERWMMAVKVYQEMLASPPAVITEETNAAYMQALDEADKELEQAAAHVDRLFINYPTK